MNDIEARMMKAKKGNFEIAYNIQSAVDCESILICAIKAVQSPTDHYQIPIITEKALENIRKTPTFVSADTIYLNEINAAYLKTQEIIGLMPNRIQSKEKIRKLNPNPFHKDHFKYIHDKDAFLCPSGQYLYFYKEYNKNNSKTINDEKVKRFYKNYEACKNCKCKNKCFSSKGTHRTIIENGNKLIMEIKLNMEKPEYKEEYSKRSRVEGPFTTLKEFYNCENLFITGKQKTEDRLTLKAVAYNLKRLYNLKLEKQYQENENTIMNQNLINTTQITLEQAVC